MKSLQMCIALGFLVCLEAIECSSSNGAYGMTEPNDERNAVKKPNKKPEVINEKQTFRSRIKNLSNSSLEDNIIEISETTIERPDKFWRNVDGDSILVETH